MQPRLTKYESCGVTLLGDSSCPGGVTFAFTGRTGGLSTGDYGSLNLGSHVGDEPACVEENRRRVLAALGAEELYSALICPHQVHGTKTCLIRTNSADELQAVREEIEAGCDAIVCTAAQVPVLLCFADCVPVVLVCEGAFAVVHSGWKGTLARISALALELLLEGSGVRPQDVKAYIGPHITGEDYEVSAELLASFEQEFGSRVCAGERRLDMAAAIEQTLLDAGMQQSSIVGCGISTFSHTDEYYSYRAQNGSCGRHGAIAVLLG